MSTQETDALCNQLLAICRIREIVESEPGKLMTDELVERVRDLHEWAVAHWESIVTSESIPCGDGWLCPESDQLIDVAGRLVETGRWECQWHGDRWCVRRIEAWHGKKEADDGE